MTTRNIYRSVGSPVVFAAAATAWATSTAYAVGALVTNGGSTYFCLTAHTSGTFATDLAAGNWLLVTAVLWAPQNQGTGTGRISNVWDRGAGNLPTNYAYACSTRWSATPAGGDSLRLYLIAALAAATPGLTAGGLTFGDAPLTSELELSSNCLPIQGPIAIGSDKLEITFSVIEIWQRYVGLAGWNSSSTKALTNTSTDHWCLFQPMPYDIEAEA